MFGKSSSAEYIHDPELIVGLDIGTSKVSVIVAEKEDGYNKPQIIAVDAIPTEGMRKGAIVNADLVSKAIKNVISSAENIVGQPLKKTSVAFSCGEAMTCVITSGKQILGVNARPVTEEDIERVMQLAKEDLAVPSNKSVIHTIPIKYQLDDTELENPLTMTGRILTVELESVMVSSSIVQNVISCVRHAGIEVENLILKPLASSLSVITREEAQGGAIVLDIGAGTTSITVYSEGHPVYLGMVPIGGDHITNDLATILKIPLNNADELKQAVALCELEDDSDETVQFIYNGRPYSVLYNDITEIISCRLEELCEDFVIPKITDSGIKSFPGGIILTGGCSKTAGIDILIRDMFDLPVRIAVPSVALAMPYGRNTQEYSAVAGIIEYVTEKHNNRYRYIDEVPKTEEVQFTNKTSHSVESKHQSLNNKKERRKVDITSKLNGLLDKVKESFDDIF